MNGRRTGLAAAMMTAALAAPAGAAGTAGTTAAAIVLPGGFAAPAEPMILSRTLRRPLPDGKEFTVTRRYRIRFLPDGDGYRVDGELVAVDVLAPESLAAFAELERTRPDTGMFPLRLDSRGLLKPSAGTASGEEVRKATELVLERMGQARMPALDLLEAQAFVQRVRQRPAASQWPADVFRPASQGHSQSSQVPLPGGALGRIAVDIVAQREEGSGLLREMTRTVTTDLGGDQRRSLETWTLAPAEG